MAREFLAMFHGGAKEEMIWYNSGTLVLLGIVFLSLLLITMVIFSCGLDDNEPYSRRAQPPRRYNSSRHGGSTTHSRKSDRRLSGLGGDGGGDGGGG